MGDIFKWLTPTTKPSDVDSSWNDPEFGYKANLGDSAGQWNTAVTTSRGSNTAAPNVDLSNFGLAAGGIGGSGKYYQGVQLSDDAVKAMVDAGQGGLLTDAPKGFLEEVGVLDDKGNLLGVSKDGWGAIQGLAGMYDTFFGTGADIRDAQLDMLGAQKDLLKQQLASNKEALENRRTFNSNWAKSSNAVMGNGLAASANS